MGVSRAMLSLSSSATRYVHDSFSAGRRSSCTRDVEPPFIALCCVTCEYVSSFFAFNRIDLVESHGSDLSTQSSGPKDQDLIRIIFPVHIGRYRIDCGSDLEEGVHRPCLVHTVRFVFVVQAVAWQIHVLLDAFDRFPSTRNDPKRVPRDLTNEDA